MTLIDEYFGEEPTSEEIMAAGPMDPDPSCATCDAHCGSCWSDKQGRCEWCVAEKKGIEQC